LHTFWLQILAGAARQPLFSVILSRSIYLSMFVRRFLPLQALGNCLMPGAAYLEIAYFILAY